MKGVQPFRYAILCLLVALAGATGAFAQSKPTDWRLYAIGKPESQDVGMFYSASEVRHKANGNIEVWMQTLPVAAVNKVKLSKAQNEEIAKRIAAGYKPLIVRSQPVPPDQLSGLIAAELKANADSVPPVERSLNELDCSGRKLRFLNVGYMSKGKLTMMEIEGLWNDVPPESILATLLDELCPASH